MVLAIKHNWWSLFKITPSSARNSQQLFREGSTLYDPSSRESTTNADVILCDWCYIDWCYIVHECHNITSTTHHLYFKTSVSGASLLQLLYRINIVSQIFFFKWKNIKKRLWIDPYSRLYQKQKSELITSRYA